MADDALDVTKINVNPGGAWRKMRDSVWQGQVWKMTLNLRIPKGMRKILLKWGVNITGTVAHQTRKILAEHDDFKNEKVFFSIF